MSYWDYPKYVSVAEKKAKAAKKLKQLKKKMPGIKPVVIEGTALACTWWGKSWNKNLERYADYSNRIGRGRSYVRHGAVLDLKIDSGKVTALVQGSTAKPYEVVIKISAINKANWKAIKKQCEGRLKSLQDLLAGKFPKALGDIFFIKEKGVFPSPQAISFDCSCPDWASMCKHVAATLYGIGARFDDDPALLFKLRGVNTGELIARAVQDKTERLLVKTTKKSAKVIEGADLANMFGLDMDSKPDFAKKKTVVSPAGTTKKTRKPVAKARDKLIDLTSKQQKNKQKPPGNAVGFVAKFIAANKKGITIGQLVEKTGFPKSKLYGIVHRLKQQDEIKNKSRGVYVKA